MTDSMENEGSHHRSPTLVTWNIITLVSVSGASVILIVIAVFFARAHCQLKRHRWVQQREGPARPTSAVVVAATAARAPARSPDPPERRIHPHSYLSLLPQEQTYEEIWKRKQQCEGASFNPKDRPTHSVATHCKDNTGYLCMTPVPKNKATASENEGGLLATRFLPESLPEPEAETAITDTAPPNTFQNSEAGYMLPTRLKKQNSLNSYANFSNVESLQMESIQLRDLPPLPTPQEPERVI